MAKFFFELLGMTAKSVTIEIKRTSDKSRYVASVMFGGAYAELVTTSTAGYADAVTTALIASEIRVNLCNDRKLGEVLNQLAAITTMGGIAGLRREELLKRSENGTPLEMRLHYGSEGLDASYRLAPQDMPTHYMPFSNFDAADKFAHRLEIYGHDVKWL